jgi:ribokinase
LKVLTIGGAMIDSIAIIPADRIERMTMRNAETSFLLLEEGKKTEAEAVSTHCGGGAVNAAVCYARLGFDVAALVKLGQDDRADQILTRLAAEGVSTRYAVRDAREATGASVLISAHDRNAAIFTFRGANTLLEPADLVADAFGVDLVHVSGLSNRSADSFPDIVGKAHAAGARLAANPGVRQLSLQHGTFLDLAARIAIFSINRTEADTLVPQVVARAGEGGPSLTHRGPGEPPRLLARGFHGGGFEVSLARFFATLLEAGFGAVIVTDGGEGAFAADATGLYHCPVLPGPIAGTAGAGDAFVATFAAATMLGDDAMTALRRATLNAGAVIRHPDTQSGLLSRTALNEALAADAARLPAQHWSLA